MDLEIIILSKSERERQILYGITYVWNIKYDTNELTYETETDSQTQRMGWLPRGKEGGRHVWGWQMQTIICVCVCD